MPWYSIQEGGKEVNRVFVLSDADLALQVRDGQSSVESTDPRLTAFVAPPPLALEDERDALWSRAKTYRDAVANGSCKTPSGIVQTDDASKLRINGAVAMAMLAKSAGTAFSIDWTMADNSVVALDADQMIAVGVAVGQFVAVCQNRGTVIRDQIDSAADADALAIIDITAGYPA